MQGWELSIGVVVGVALGIAIDNVGLGIVMGIFGGGMFWALSSKQDEKKGEEEKNG